MKGKQEQLTWINTRVLVVYGNFLWHLFDEITGLFCLSPIIWRPVHLCEWWNMQKILIRKYNIVFSKQSLRCFFNKKPHVGETKTQQEIDRKMGGFSHRWRSLGLWGLALENSQTILHLPKRRHWLAGSSQGSQARLNLLLRGNRL